MLQYYTYIHMSIAYMILDFRKTQTILEIKESTETQFNVPFVLLDITFLVS